MHGRNLHWEKLPAWWQAGDDDIFGDGTTYRIFLPSPGVYELWVWSGPAEGSGVLGAMGADLRSQKRAKRLGSYAHLGEAKRAAARHLG